MLFPPTDSGNSSVKKAASQSHLETQQQTAVIQCTVRLTEEGKETIRLEWLSKQVKTTLVVVAENKEINSSGRTSFLQRCDVGFDSRKTQT